MKESVHWVGTPAWGHQARAHDRKYPLADRIIAAALAVVNREGHARFVPGDLALAVSVLDEITGELLEPASSTISRALRKLKDEGLIREDSKRECIRLTDRVYAYGTGKASAKCMVHRTA